MILRDFHLHTTFSDGKNSPEEMVQAAIRLGMEEIGFSDHSYTDFDESYCVKKENRQVYRDTVTALKEKYAGKIKIYCGIEQDYFSGESTRCYDYAIGSVHYLKVGNAYIDVDRSAEYFRQATDRYFSGDPLSFAEEYFSLVADVVEKTNADIIGHFDLVSKLNGNRLFDPTHDRYVKAWQKAADKLLLTGKPFEINTGAICRGYKEFPYPAEDMIAYIRERGGRFLLSSDAHSAEGLRFQFDKWEYLL